MKQLLKLTKGSFAVDVERNELVLMREYTTRNWLITDLLSKFSNTARTLLIKLGLLKLKSLELNLSMKGFRSLVESAFSSFKQRIKILYSITADSCDIFEEVMLICPRQRFLLYRSKMPC